ncbi:acetyltransferase-like protein [Kribbella flavida DSM 17836]|uniref:Acetyltransferase-like protein n=1 Tax=Kribbella flavida (strain DSM 17836 / JCM 10339 / NBRC 14399) TaxID=479435 RepID=D2PVR7_KRIFD|nr:GNAT family N-acetyltransferase [Kribbella flavida]ADB35307.1 acetyltransferase-like protein [Kribbella flavida DSM 17836]
MATRVTNDPAEFRTTVFPFLERDPVLHTVILSNVDQRAGGDHQPEAGEGVYVSVHDDTGQVVGAAMRTPGRGVYLGGLAEQYAAEVAEAYAEHVPDLPGVGGARPAADAFVQRWTELRGATATESRSTRLHRLEELVRLQADGGPRLATEDEAQLAAEWVAIDFGDELRDTLAWAEGKIKQGALWFWEVDGMTVSLVAHQLPVFGVCRVGPVYTPDEFRRNGFGGALTAYVSGEILAAGHQACLYTDLANPTSNKIYRLAGYRPVADFVELEFG